MSWELRLFCMTSLRTCSRLLRTQHVDLSQFLQISTGGRYTLVLERGRQIMAVQCTLPAHIAAAPIGTQSACSPWKWRKNRRSLGHVVSYLDLAACVDHPRLKSSPSLGHISSPSDSIHIKIVQFPTTMQSFIPSIRLLPETHCKFFFVNDWVVVCNFPTR
jgi:hypothetical protein